MGVLAVEHFFKQRLSFAAIWDRVRGRRTDDEAFDVSVAAITASRERERDMSLLIIITINVVLFEDSV